MYTVGVDQLPTVSCAVEAAELMNETLIWAEENPHTNGVKFIGEVFQDTPESDRFSVLVLSGVVVGTINEPPSFTLRPEEMDAQIAACDCPGFDPDDIFSDFEQLVAESELSRELDEFAGAETKCPHYEEIPLVPGLEVTIRFDRVGSNIVGGTVPGVFE